MTLYVHGRPAHQYRRRRAAVSAVAVLVLAATVLAVSMRSSWGRTPDHDDPAALGHAAGPGAPGTAVAVVPEVPQSADIPADTSAVTGLDPDLLARFEAAQRGAAADGVKLTLTSGWRSAKDQQRLVDDTLQRYHGDEDEAHRWVLPPATSAHVAGLAIDVGPTEGALWLGKHGTAYGLCRVYDNEVWHFEPLTDPGGTCPPTHPDSSWGWR